MKARDSLSLHRQFSAVNLHLLYCEQAGHNSIQNLSRADLSTLSPDSAR